MSNIGLSTDLVLANTSVRPGTLVLPLSTQIPGRTITIKCATGSCAVSTCYISTSGGDTFEDGSTTQALTTNYGFIKVTSRAGKWYTGVTTQPAYYTASTINAAATQATAISTGNMTVSSLSLGSTNALYTSSSLAYWGPYLLNSGFRTAQPQIFYPLILPTVITSGLVNRWLFSEGTGTTFADSVGGQNGTLYGTPTWVTGNTGSRNAIYFNNSTNSQYGISSAGGTVRSVCTTTTYTVCCWIYPLSFFKNGADVYLSICDPSNGYRYVNWWVSNSSGNLACYQPNITTYVYYDNGSVKFTLNTWNHFVFVASAGSVVAYVNGVAGPTGTLTQQNISASSCMYFGVDYNGSIEFYVNMRIDDVRLYNRALSPSEVSQIYNGTG